MVENAAAIKDEAAKEVAKTKKEDAPSPRPHVLGCVGGRWVEEAGGSGCLLGLM